MFGRKPESERKEEGSKRKERQSSRQEDQTIIIQKKKNKHTLDLILNRGKLKL